MKAAGPSIVIRRPAGSTSPASATPGGLHRVLGQRLPRPDVPDSQVEIVAVGEETPAVRREADRTTAAVQPVSGQLVDLLAARDVPQTDGIIQAGRDQEPAVGRDRDSPDPVTVQQSPALDAGGGIPDADRVIVAGGGDEPAGCRRDLIDPAAMTGGARRHFLADSPVPDMDADSAGGRQPAAIGREGDVFGRCAGGRHLAHQPPRAALQQQDAPAEILAPPVAIIGDRDRLAIGSDGQAAERDIIADLDLMPQITRRHVPLVDEGFEIVASEQGLTVGGEDQAIDSLPRQLQLPRLGAALPVPQVELPGIGAGPDRHELAVR